MIGVLAGLLPAPAEEPAPAVLSVDRLLGDSRRALLEERLAKALVNGQFYTWKQYAKWGEELIKTGQVQQPPIGPAPSPLLSKHYKCADCHNLEREDWVLTEQNPDVRAWMIETGRRFPQPHSAGLSMTTGTTFWGMVNRESYYNGAYEVYHSLPLADNRPMNPKSLEDSAQVCCKYCSIGRFAEPWEIHGVLAFLWDLELKLTDLDLPPSVAEVVQQTLTAPDAPEAQIKAMRSFVRRQYLRHANAGFTPPPMILPTGEVGPYPDKLEFRGDPKIGSRLYQQACDRCHGVGKTHQGAGSQLVEDLGHFHHIVSHGTARDESPYMPMFTIQRLSRQQVIDIQAHLLSLKSK